MHPRALGLLFFVAGCGTSTYAPYNDFEVALDRAFCQTLLDCCSMQQVLSQDYSSLDGCLASRRGARDKADRTAQAAGTPTLEEELTSGRLIYDDAAANSCLTAAQALSCDSAANLGALAALTCPKAVRGTIAMGAGCLLGGLECAPGLYCYSVGNAATMGNCTPYPAAGAACAYQFGCDYDAGLVCLPGQVCGAPLGAGQPCSESSGDAGQCSTLMCEAGACAQAISLRQYLCYPAQL